MASTPIGRDTWPSGGILGVQKEVVLAADRSTLAVLVAPGRLDELACTCGRRRATA
jgi:hypothetical protein